MCREPKLSERHALAAVPQPRIVIFFARESTVIPSLLASIFAPSPAAASSRRSSFVGRQHQRRKVAVGPGLGVGALLQQQFHNLVLSDMAAQISPSSRCSPWPRGSRPCPTAASLPRPGFVVATISAVKPWLVLASMLAPFSSSSFTNIGLAFVGRQISACAISALARYSRPGPAIAAPLPYRRCGGLDQLVIQAGAGLARRWIDSRQNHGYSKDTDQNFFIVSPWKGNELSATL